MIVMDIIKLWAETDMFGARVYSIMDNPITLDIIDFLAMLDNKSIGTTMHLEMMALVSAASKTEQAIALKFLPLLQTIDNGIKCIILLDSIDFNGMSDKK